MSQPRGDTVPQKNAPDKPPAGRWALLIGIDEYPRWPARYQLGGCLNDLDAMETVLVERFGFPQSNILKLTSPAADRSRLADRDTIIEAWSVHLADNQRIRHGDVVVIYYSGHGSYIPDVHGDAEDGYDETLVPCDSGADRGDPAQVRDISDHEISLLIDRVAARSRNVNCIFDSCHSGSVTRARQDCEAVDGRGRERWLPPATCPEVPTQLGLRVPRRGTRSLGPGGWLPLSDGYVALSACRASERAREGDFWTSILPPKRVRHGVFTHYLLEALYQAGPETAYLDLWNRVRAKVIRRNRWQNPQIEGAYERRVLGGSALPRKRYLEVIARHGDQVTIDAGRVLGATVGSLFALYRAGTGDPSDGGERAAVIKLREVGAFTSTGGVESGDAKAVEVGSPALEIEHDYGAMRMGVRVVGNDPTLDAARREIEASALLVPRTAGEAPARATVRLGRPATDGEPMPESPELCILSDDGHALAMPVDAGNPRLLRRRLEHIARYDNLLAIRNVDPRGTLRGKVDLRLLKVVGRKADGSDRLERLVPDAGGDQVLRVGDRIVVAIENRADRPLHVALFDCDCEWQMQSIFPPPAAEDDLVAAGGTRHTIRFKVDLPARHKPVRRDLPLPRETLKLIATTERLDFRSLWLAPMRGTGASPGAGCSLGELVRRVAGGGASHVTRSLEKGADPAAGDWTSAEIAFHIIT